MSKENKLAPSIGVVDNQLTIFSRLRKTPILPKRTWNGEHVKVPSGCSTTITSMAPVSVAAFISL